MPLEFDAATHTYTLDGRVLPSVTQVLKEARICDYSMIPQAVLQFAAERGTAVHLATQLLDEGDLDVESLDPVLAPYVQAWEKFKAETGFVSERIEKRIVNETYFYAGTYDRVGIGIFQGGRRGIVDIKSGILLPGHHVQLAAYAEAMGEPATTRRMLVQLRPDGQYRIEETPRSEFQRNFKVFLAALTCLHWRIERGEKIR